MNQTQKPMPRKFLQQWVKILLPELLKARAKGTRNLAKSELTLVWLPTSAAKKLNLQHRGRNYATDVLSFAALQDPADRTLALGELVLCPQVLERQAKEHDLSFRAELGYLVLHGILHLLGYDHETSAREEKKMLGLQDRIFAVAARKMDLD